MPEISRQKRMSKTVDCSLSTRTRQYLVAAVLVGSFVVPVLGAVLSTLRLTVPRAFAGATVAWLVLTALWVGRMGGTDDSDAWGGIPQWQYGGRFAEAGGLTKQEQEEALERLGDEE